MLSVVEDSESSANIANSDLINILNSDSDSSDILLPLRKIISNWLLKMILTMTTMVINNQSYGFGKKKLINQKSGTIRRFLA